MRYFSIMGRVAKSIDAVSDLLSKGLTGTGKRLNDEEAVHCARVQSKRLRAALLLYKGFIPKREYRRIKNHLQRAAEILSRRRDDHVIRAQLLRCAECLSGSEKAETLAWVNSQFHNGTADDSETSIRSAERQLRYALDHWPRPDGIETSSFIERGTKRTWRKTKKLAECAVKSRKTQDFHRLRIWTKQLFFQLQLAKEVGLKSDQKTINRLEKLQSCLGKLHDLAIAQKFLDSRNRKIAFVKDLRALASRRQKQLEQKSLRGVRKLF